MVEQKHKRIPKPFTGTHTQMKQSHLREHRNIEVEQIELSNQLEPQKSSQLLILPLTVQTVRLCLGTTGERFPVFPRTSFPLWLLP